MAGKKLVSAIREAPKDEGLERRGGANLTGGAVLRADQHLIFLFLAYPQFKRKINYTSPNYKTGQI
jgi:hypothetical protein